ncbi:Dip2/Utp12 family-domain-containing protein [Xylogone sp. PMI_703]|nr:Dip2/Utp12 family-domain-containing protein [Xylogone sp. PMI_703]
MSTKRKLPTKLGQPTVKQSARSVGKGSLDESSTVVSGGGHALKSGLGKQIDTIEISESSQDEGEEIDEEEEEDDNDEEDNDGAEDDAENKSKENPGAEDLDMNDVGGTPKKAVSGEDDEEDNEESAEPAFGDLVRANGLEQIDVAGAFESGNRALSYAPRQRTTATSVGTVLTQALKTNDTALLESCLHNTDVKIIQATIERLESPLAGTLLQKLAERLHRRPGRAGSLMIWVQWTIIVHGGYLATQPDLIKKLAELHRVIDQRARSLQPLLSLKGKLDLLEAQLQLRKSMQSRNRGSDDEFEEEDEAVIYVEGQESDEDDNGVAINGTSNRLTRKDVDDMSGDESEQSEDMPLTNGMVAESDEEEEDSEDDEDLIDNEAEETDADTDDEAEVDHDDLDSQGDEEESDDAAQAPPPKIKRVNGMFSKRG